MSGPELLTAEELGRFLGIRPETVRAWSRRGRIPKMVLSRKVIRFDKAAVVAALQAQQRKAADYE